ncbi:MAG: UDP-N-acetylglucosamine 2-epimerase, partial [Anaerolineales bacterium]|nr:UDP-N-acetylglucosamine 2-epimerase [Anaerolineales bacterium]
MKILNVVGARPNMMKIAPLVSAIQQHPTAEQILLHTGQHYDEKMSQIFFDELGIPQPDIYLGVGSASHAVQTAKIMVAFEEVLQQHQPDVVVVVGDVNSTVACSLTATKMHVPVAHVEAGLRSGDRRMPEEINRLVVDAISDYLFTTSRGANANLRQEGVPDDKIFFVGNLMIDTLNQHKARAQQLNTP